MNRDEGSSTRNAVRAAYAVRRGGAPLSQQAAIAEMAQRALSETNFQRLLDEACSLVRLVLDAELVDVLALDPDGAGLGVVAGIGWNQGVVGVLHVAIDKGSQSGYTLATGEPVVVPDLAAETRFAISPVLREHGARSGISVRIGAHDRPYGVLACFSLRPDAFSADDARFLQSMANVLGSAVARLLTEAALRRSRDELATIVANVTDGITVQSPNGELAFANDAAARLLGYPDGAAFLAAPRSEWQSRFELLEESGEPMAIERLPGRVAIATGRPSPETLVRFRIRATGEERWSIVQSTPVFDAGGEISQVVNIFRDFTAQHRAEVGQALLADATAVLSSTLDVDEAARRLARLCVPQLADYCVVDLLEPNGAMRGAAIAHADPSRLAAVTKLREVRPPDINAPTGAAAVIRSGKSELMPIIPPELIADAFKDSPAELRRIVDELALRSYLCVPLMARRQAIGAVSLVHAESGRRFDEQDLRLAEEIGARAGVAIENARLYEAVDVRRAELDAVIAAMDEAVLFFDEREALRLSNRSAARLFPTRVPSTVDELTELLTAATGDEEEAGVRPAGLAEIAGEMRMADTGRWVDVSVYPTASAGRAGSVAPGTPAVVVLRDITAARAAAFARDAFMGVLSHELRTPITTIYGGSELLERGLEPDQADEVVRDIRTEAERLARLVEDLLVMSRVERGGVEIGDDPVLIQRVLPQLVSALQARWPGLSVNLAIDEGLPAVRGDATYLEQVMRNLLTNAVRYGDALGAGVELTVVAQDGDREVAVRVLDRGPGVGPDSPEKLFELFYRAPAAKRVPGGAGIGLFVCRQLVEAMGGRIWARPRAEGGAEFGFALPAIETDIVA